MIYLRSAIAGLAGAAAGWFFGTFAVILGAGLLGLGDREGATSMMAAFTVGPLCGLAGLVLAVRFSMGRGGARGAGAFGRHLASALAAVLVVAGAVAAYFTYTQPYVSGNGLPPDLVFEIRMPGDSAPPALVSRAEALARRSPIELQTSENTMSAEIAGTRIEEGRPVLSGRVEMAFRARDRFLVFKEPEGDVVFSIDLPRTPTSTTEFGEWEPPTVPPGAARPEGYHIRYRTVIAGEE